MKITKRIIWSLGILGIVAAVILVAFVRYRAASGELVVQLVDKETGKPMGNLKVTVEEFDNIPLLYKYDFLPGFMRWRTSSRVIKSGGDGTFGTRRIDGDRGDSFSHFTVEVDGVRKVELGYVDGSFCVARRSYDVTEIHPFPVPKGGILVIPLDPAWMR